MEKAYYDRQRCSAARSDSQVFRDDDGVEKNTTLYCFKCDKTSHWVKICPSSCLSPGPCANCGRAGHWGVDCPDLLRRGRLIPQGPPPRDSLWTFWIGQGRLMLPWVLCPQQNQDYHRGTFSDCLGNRQSVCHF